MANVLIDLLMSSTLIDPERHLDEAKVARFTEILDELPPVVVFETPEGVLVADGYHRIAAARRLGRTTIEAEIRDGSRRDALRWATSNAAAERGISEAQALEHINRHSAARWGSRP